MSAAASTFSKDDYKNALQAIGIFEKNPVYRALLRAHYEMPDRTTSATALGHAVGLGDGDDLDARSAVNLKYGQLGGWLSEELHYTSEHKVDVMFDYYVPKGDTPSGFVEYRMADGLAEALEELGIV